MQCDEDNLATPVTNPTVTQICLVLMTMADSHGHIVCVEGAFSMGRHKIGEPIPINVEKVPVEDGVPTE